MLDMFPSFAFLMESPDSPEVPQDKAPNPLMPYRLQLYK